LYLDSIVEDFGCRMQREVVQGTDDRLAPPMVSGPGDLEHVVGKLVTKDQVVGVWLGTELVGLALSDLQVRERERDEQ
jgi:hypothetical protein